MSRKSFRPVKPFLTYQELLVKLSDDKNLIIPDLESAKSILTDISYYALMNGYKSLYYDRITRQYVTGTSFNDILALYYFDERLRSLGQISKMYSLLAASLKAKISLHFHAVSEKELAQYLKALTHFRNVCAHNERLFSFRCRIDIPDTRLHGKLSIPRKGTQYLQGKSDLFAVVIALRYLLSRKDFSTFRQELSRLISMLLKQSPMLPEERLLTAMGFPGGWKSLTRYRL